MLRAHQNQVVDIRKRRLVKFGRLLSWVKRQFVSIIDYGTSDHLHVIKAPPEGEKSGEDFHFYLTESEQHHLLLALMHFLTRIRLRLLVVSAGILCQGGWRGRESLVTKNIKRLQPFQLTLRSDDHIKLSHRCYLRGMSLSNVCTEEELRVFNRFAHGAEHASIPS